tara:strand:- start:1 stop:117 length:117 start_codon:yes stop_codon:yes gene_type:complete
MEGAGAAGQWEGERKVAAEVAEVAAEAEEAAVARARVR